MALLNTYDMRIWVLPKCWFLVHGRGWPVHWHFIVICEVLPLFRVLNDSSCFFVDLVYGGFIVSDC